MDTIAFTPVIMPVQRASRLAVALDSLDAWLNAESGNLEDLLEITGHGNGVDDIVALGRLHLAPGARPEDVRRLLEDAMPPLERLLDRVWLIPLEGPFTDPSGLDTWICRSEARLDAGIAVPGHCNHSLRATGITTYIAAGGALETAQAIAGHASPRTTQLYDRTGDEIALDEIERIIL